MSGHLYLHTILDFFFCREKKEKMFFFPLLTAKIATHMLCWKRFVVDDGVVVVQMNAYCENRHASEESVRIDPIFFNVDFSIWMK